MRLSYPASVKIIKVPCTGRVDAVHMLEAFANGADGVCLVGCLEGDCHFISGNIRAGKRVSYAKTLLDETGIGAERLVMYYLSAADGHKFAQFMREMTEKIQGLGPNPIKRAMDNRLWAMGKDSP